MCFFLIFRVARWQVSVYCHGNQGVWPEERLSRGAVGCQLHQSLWSRNDCKVLFHGGSDWQRNYSYSDLGSWQTFSWNWKKRASPFKEDNQPLLPPMIKSGCLTKKQNFRKLVSDTLSLMALQYLQIFLMRSMVILTNVIFWYRIMNYTAFGNAA